MGWWIGGLVGWWSGLVDGLDWWAGLDWWIGGLAEWKLAAWGLEVLQVTSSTLGQRWVGGLLFLVLSFIRILLLLPLFYHCHEYYYYCYPPTHRGRAC